MASTKRHVTLLSRIIHIGIVSKIPDISWLCSLFVTPPLIYLVCIILWLNDEGILHDLDSGLQP